MTTNGGGSSDPFDQSSARIRFEWGLAGALALTSRSMAASARSPQVVVVVDMLSFTTSVSVALDGGIDVFPFRWRDDRAASYAVEVGAELARRRSEGGVSLSPASIRSAVGVERLVLPSPNGSTISFALQDGGSTVLAGCLRNATATGRWVADRLASDPAASACVIAAGEHWHDGSLRPAVEDQWGAGAVIAALLERASVPASPEALSAAAAFRAVESDLRTHLFASSSGRELADSGFGADVEIAAEYDSTSLVALLSDDRFHPASASL